jgi:integrase
MGLEWSDIDFDNGTITVERASQYLPGKGTFEKTPKTEGSKRTLALPGNVLGLLKQYRSEWLARQLKLGYLFRGIGVLDNFDELFNTVMPKGSGEKLLGELRDKSPTEDKWEENINKLTKRNVDESLIDELKHLQAKASIEVTALNELTDKQLQDYVSIWRETNKATRIFPTWNGRPGSPTWPVKWLDKFLTANKLPHCSFHSLRHLNATMQIKAGVPLKNISARLGHTDIGTTANIYAEALKSVDREAAEALGVLLENKSVDKEKSDKLG